MCSDQPLVCCICAHRFAGNAGGVRGHHFREGVCSFACHVRKTWRASRSILGGDWDRDVEDAHVAQHVSALTDEEHERARRRESTHVLAKVRNL
jgi:hypothetical protein